MEKREFRNNFNCKSGFDNSPGDNIWQVLKSSLYSYLVGKQVTLSFLMGDGNFIYGTTTIPENDGSLKFAYFSDSPNSYFAVGGGNQPHIAIINNTSTNLVFCACKLELGPIQTLAHKDASGNWVLNDPPLNYQQELAKCQRYQLMLGGSAYTPIGMFVQSISNQLACHIPIPTSFCAKPAISSHGAFRVIWPNENKLVSFTSNGDSNISNSSIIVGLVPSVEISSGVGWIDTADAQSYVLLDCNL